MVGASGFQVDLSAWQEQGTMEPIIDWQDAVNIGNVTAMNKIMASVIAAWPWEGDPRDVSSYRKLTPAQWKQTAKEVGDAVSRFFLG